MAIQVEQRDLQIGGVYDADFRKSYVCGRCGSRLVTAFKHGRWWLRCSKDWAHGSFREEASWSTRRRRGDNTAADLLRGPLHGQRSMAEDPRRLEAGQRRTVTMLEKRRADGHTPESDYRDLFGKGDL